MISSKPNSFPKALPPNTITLGVGALTMNWGGGVAGEQKHSVHNSHLVSLISEKKILNKKLNHTCLSYHMFNLCYHMFNM